MAAESNDNFYYSVLKQSVARCCRSVGWHGVHNGSCDILTDLLGRYIMTIARTANGYANLGMRSLSSVISHHVFLHNCIAHTNFSLTVVQLLLFLR